MEEWRDIPGYESWYQVSDLGRVKRARPYSGRGHRAMGGMLKQQDVRGYLSVTLCTGNRKSHRGWKVHRLVALAFIGPRPAGYEVNHKDGNRANNIPQNLEYVTRSQNHKHAYRVLGRNQNGEKNPACKWTEADIISMRRMRAHGVPLKEIAKHFSAAISSVSPITRGVLWGHVEPQSYLLVSSNPT